MSFIGLLRALSPVRWPRESGQVLQAAWRTARDTAEQPETVPIDGTAPSRMLRDLRRTAVLAAACGGVAAIGTLGLYLGSGDVLQLVAGSAFVAMFAITGLSARRRASRIAAWLEQE